MEAVRRASRGHIGPRTSTSSSPPTDSRDDQWDEVEEDQPLIRRSSTQIDPQQFQEARNEAVQQAALESGWFTWVIFIFAFCLFGFWLYVNVKSWCVLVLYWDAPCDEPLSEWLLVKLVLDIISSALQQRQRSRDTPRPITWIILFMVNAWLVFGFNWCSEAKTCQTTSPQLYNWVYFLVIFGTVVTLVLMLLPVLFYMAVILLVHLIGSGSIKNQRAARDDTLDLLERVEFRPDIFADSSDPNDERPSGECCCCCEEFNSEKAIVKTPCQHFFHEECLAEWLKLAKTCPICRSDLDLATEALTVDKQMAAAGLDLEDPPSSTSGARGSTD